MRVVGAACADGSGGRGRMVGELRKGLLEWVLRRLSVALVERRRRQR